MQPCPDDPQGEGWWVLDKERGSWQAGEWPSVGTEQENTVVVSVYLSFLPTLVLLSKTSGSCLQEDEDKSIVRLLWLWRAPANSKWVTCIWIFFCQETGAGTLQFFNQLCVATVLLHMQMISGKLSFWPAHIPQRDQTVKTRQCL